MFLIDAQCIKDLFFLSDSLWSTKYLWTTMTSIDMVAVPFYAFILIELCSPGHASTKKIIRDLTPFIILPILYICTGIDLFYIVEVVWAAIYGFGYAVWTIFAIKRYNTFLKQQFSYNENINLDWLRSILVFFIGNLCLWFVDCSIINVDIECIYLIGSLILWMALCYFIYRHKNVIDELKTMPNGYDHKETDDPVEGDDNHESKMSIMIKRLFDDEKVYLNPNLKLADIAIMVGSNRTYVSRFFNAEQNSSFFDFVNGYRIKMAVELLKNSDEKIEVIAVKVGFNSRQAFHRVFYKSMGITPERYRTRFLSGKE